MDNHNFKNYMLMYKYSAQSSLTFESRMKSKHSDDPQPFNSDPISTDSYSENIEIKILFK